MVTSFYFFLGNFEVLSSNVTFSTTCAFKADITSRFKNTEYFTGQEKRNGESWRFWNLKSAQ